MREHCLQALESFVSRSPFDARPLVVDGGVLELALALLSYDPNYVDGMEDEDGGDDDEDVYVWTHCRAMDASGARSMHMCMHRGSDDEDDYSDDEDVSWKVGSYKQRTNAPNTVCIGPSCRSQVRRRGAGGLPRHGGAPLSNGSIPARRTLSRAGGAGQGRCLCCLHHPAARHRRCVQTVRCSVMLVCRKAPTCAPQVQRRLHGGPCRPAAGRCSQRS